MIGANMDLRTRIADLMPQARIELTELVAMKSVADATSVPAGGMRANRPVGAREVP